jgi:hypothetical protein
LVAAVEVALLVAGELLALLIVLLYSKPNRTDDQFQLKFRNEPDIYSNRNTTIKLFKYLVLILDFTSKDLSIAVAKTSASSLLEKLRPYTCLLSLH